MIHTVKGFGVVNETEINVSLESPSFLCDPVNVGNLISGSSSFTKPSLDIWKFLVHIMLKPSMQDFKHDLTSMDPWRRKWRPTPVFLPGELHGQRILVGYSLWGCRVGHDWAINTTSMGDECNCQMVSTFFGTILPGNWDEDWPFPVLWSLLGLPDLLT